MSVSPTWVSERYRLISPLGAGGMGRVWLARDEMLRRDVAIKEVVPPHSLTDGEREELRRRTIREARAAARLSDPHVVRIYDVIYTEQRPWIVMEYVPSRSLHQVITEDGPLTPHRAAQIGLDVLAALKAAHVAGVLHRDVKPGNVLLADTGRVVLTDFGLAIFEGGDGTVTRPGLILGSPQYIAPERAREGISGPEADLWSLGATLYAAVEGRSPYARSTTFATLTALATEDPDPPRRAGPLKPVLNALLRKDPRARASAAETERLLLRVASGEGRMWPWSLPRQRRSRDGLPLVAPMAARPVAPARPKPETSAEPATLVEPSVEPASAAPPAARTPLAGPASAMGPAASAAAPPAARTPAPPAAPAGGAPASAPAGGAPASAPAGATDVIADPTPTASLAPASDVTSVLDETEAEASAEPATSEHEDQVEQEDAEAAAPEVVESEAAESEAAAGSAAVESELAEPEVAEPEAAEPEVAEAAGAPEVAEPEVAESEAEPQTAESEAVATETAHSEANEPEAAHAEPAATPTEAEPAATQTKAEPAATQTEVEPDATPTRVEPPAKPAESEEPVSEIASLATAPKIRFPGKARGSAQVRAGTRPRGGSPANKPPGEAPRWRWVVIVAAVVAAIVAAGLIIDAVRDDTRTSNNNAASATSAPAATPGGASPSVSTPDASTTTGAPSPAGSPQGPGSGGPGRFTLPAGFHWYTDPEYKWSIAVPDGWTESRDRGYPSMIYFTEPTTPRRRLGVDRASNPKPDPVADWTNLETTRVRNGDFPGYTRVRLVKVDYFRAAADWVYSYNGTSGRLQVCNRGFVVNDNLAHAIFWLTPAAQWDENISNWELIVASFQPGI
jgi:hypothetical protein